MLPTNIYLYMFVFVFMCVCDKIKRFLKLNNILNYR